MITYVYITIFSSNVINIKTHLSQFYQIGKVTSTYKQKMYIFLLPTQNGKNITLVR